jgi:hypothetical protein
LTSEASYKGDQYETLAICRSLELARAAFEVAIAEKPARPIHDPQRDPRGEAAPGGRLVRANSGLPLHKK